MIGADYLNGLWRNTSGRLKKLVGPLFKDGIGDKMDKGNLWIVPGFTILAFALLWCTKLSKIALEESTCRGDSAYISPLVNDEAVKHCQTAKRYYVGINEPFSYEPAWREARQVKNPEWILWFWAPIVFVMYVLTRYLWSLLMDNQGINFNNIVNASQSVMADNDGVTEVAEEKLYDRVPVVADNFRNASSSNAFAAFMVFEFILVIAPLLLLIFVLPIMIGGNYRSWGFDVARAWWEKKEWQGTVLNPLVDFTTDGAPLVPLIPRVTYCDYHYVTMMNDHVVTYRCYLDSTWHERTALFTWIMLVFLSFINLCNLFFWFLWACRMRNKWKRQRWVMKKWLNQDDFSEKEFEMAPKFAASWKMGSILMFYYIEAHTDRVVASAFAAELFRQWMDRHQHRGNGYSIDIPKFRPRKNRASTPENETLINPVQNDDWGPPAVDIGWNTPGFGNSNGFGTTSGFSSNPNGPSAPPQNLYSDTPDTFDTGFSSSDNASQRTDSPKRPNTPPTRQAGFYASNLGRSRSPQVQPQNDWGEPLGAPGSPSKLKDKRKFEKRKKDENSDGQQHYLCAIM